MSKLKKNPIVKIGISGNSAKTRNSYACIVNYEGYSTYKTTLYNSGIDFDVIEEELGKDRSNLISSLIDQSVDSSARNDQRSKNRIRHSFSYEPCESYTAKYS